MYVLVLLTAKLTV